MMKGGYVALFLKVVARRFGMEGHVALKNGAGAFVAVAGRRGAGKSSRCLLELVPCRNLRTRPFGKFLARFLAKRTAEGAAHTR